jgi:AraC-like DNA-binding protein
MLPLLTARPLAQAFARGGLELERRFGFLLSDTAGLEAEQGKPQLRGAQREPPAPAGAVPDSVFSDLFAYAMGETGREGLAVEMKEALPIGVFGPLDYLASASSSVAEGTRFVCHHFALIAGETALEIQDTGPPGIRVSVRNGKWFPSFELSDELALSLLAGRFCDLAVAPVWPVEVHLTRPKPRAEDAWQAAFGAARLHYAQPTASITYTRDAWHTPLRSAVPQLAQLLDAQLRSASAQTAVVGEARGAIRSLLAEGAAQARVAERLGVSARSLQRALADAGLTFRELQAEVRSAEAARWLSDPRLRIQDVADRLGFYELASFSRAFRAWTGMSPAEYRRELQRRRSG